MIVHKSQQINCLHMSKIKRTSNNYRYAMLLFMYIVLMRQYKIFTLNIHIFMPLGQAPGSKWQRYRQGFLEILICLSAHTLTIVRRRLFLQIKCTTKIK